MKNKFNIGFWNYVDLGVLDNANAAADWRELGMNLAMSFEYNESLHKKEDMLKHLDECFSKGIEVIVCDSRVHLKSFMKDEEYYQKNVEKAYNDFGNHPAFKCFFLIDEPKKEHFNALVIAAKIVKKIAKISPFVNFYPMWRYSDYQDLVGVTPEEYESLVKRLTKECELEMLCYDCYYQCYERNRDEGLDSYFRNLNLFYRVAKECNVPVWTTLLSVGHWNYRIPSENDYRWQISTAVSHGMKSILWFFIYERTLDGSYRNSPIDLFNERTESFTLLKRQNNIFNKFFKELIENSELESVQHLTRSYGETEHFIPCGRIVNLTTRYSLPICVSRFKGKDKDFVIFTNLSQTESEFINISFQDRKEGYWLAPGQMSVEFYD